MKLSPEIIAGALGTIGGVVLVLHRLGFLKIGKCKPTACPDPDCKTDVAMTKQEVATIKETVGSISEQQGQQWVKLGEIAEDVAFIRGKLGDT